jgi:hypothetical protein
MMELLHYKNRNYHHQKGKVTLLIDNRDRRNLFPEWSGRKPEQWRHK